MSAFLVVAIAMVAAQVKEERKSNVQMASECLADVVAEGSFECDSDSDCIKKATKACGSWLPQGYRFDNLGYITKLKGEALEASQR